MEQEYMLEMLGIDKRYGGVHALKGVDLRVKKGEIHALMGENGAGKSTLMKVLSGAIAPNEGSIAIDGQVCSIQKPSDAQEHGVGIIYQEFTLVPSLSVAENIFLGNIPRKGGMIDWGLTRKNARQALERIGFDIDVTVPVAKLSVAYQQMIEITKALSKNVRILVLDEPTSVLAPNEVEMLFKVIASLKEQGVTMIYISHKLDEVFRICDSVTVLKDGAYAGSGSIADMDQDTLISMMIGRKLETLFPTRAKQKGDVVLDVRDLSSAANKDCSLTLHKGEIVGLSGLVGSGRTELARAIFGADPITSGEVHLNGQKVVVKSPRQAVRMGFGLVPEDRKGQGVILDKSIRQNITISSPGKISSYGVIKHLREKTEAKGMIDRLRIKAPSGESNVGDLSGGNQQKVALAKWIFCDCQVVIFDEPTRGVDVGAKSEIYQLINELAEAGKGVVIISSEMEEIIGLCDRVYVLHEGRITGSVEGDEISEDAIMRYAIS